MYKILNNFGKKRFAINSQFINQMPNSYIKPYISLIRKDLAYIIDLLINS